MVDVDGVGSEPSLVDVVVGTVVEVVVVARSGSMLALGTGSVCSSMTPSVTWRNRSFMRDSVSSSVSVSRRMDGGTSSAASFWAFS